tara:strand:- start:2238 stop:2792 length:555 start_codon:yes stop_codon:yes gene_type:complete
MAIAETLTLAKALSTAGGLASSYGPAAASMKRTKEQKELTKKRQAEEQKLAKTQGTPKAEDVAAAKNPIEAALTQQRAMLARGQQTGMQQQQQRDLTRTGIMAQARIGSDLAAQEAARRGQERQRLDAGLERDADRRQRDKQMALQAAMASKGEGQKAAFGKGVKESLDTEAGSASSAFGAKTQ